MQYRRPAFTLIELLIVIAIIGILATLVIVQTGDSNRKARNATAQSDIVQLGKAVESFRIEDAASGQVISNPSNTVDQQGGGRTDFPSLFTGTQSVSALTYAAAVSKTPGPPYIYRYVASGTQTGQPGRQLVKGAVNQPAYALCTSLVGAATPYFCASDTTGGGGSQSDQVLASEGVGNLSTTAATDNLVARYQFEGDLTDSSGNNGAQSGGATVFGPGKFGQAYVSSGSQFIKVVTTVSVHNPLTLSAWINPTGTAVSSIMQRNGPFFFGYGDPPTGNNAGKFCMNILITGWGNALCGATSLQLNTWSLVTATYDGSVINVYLNGKLDGQKTNVGGLAFSDFFIAGGFGPSFPGSIDDVRVYNRLLAPVEVQQLYQGTL